MIVHFYKRTRVCQLRNVRKGVNSKVKKHTKRFVLMLFLLARSKSFDQKYSKRNKYGLRSQTVPEHL